MVTVIFKLFIFPWEGSLTQGTFHIMRAERGQTQMAITSGCCGEEIMHRVVGF